MDRKSRTFTFPNDKNKKKPTVEHLGSWKRACGPKHEADKRKPTVEHLGSWKRACGPKNESEVEN